jgi:hypothetical protein
MTNVHTGKGGFHCHTRSTALCNAIVFLTAGKRVRRRRRGFPSSSRLLGRSWAFWIVFLRNEKGRSADSAGRPKPTLTGPLRRNVTSYRVTAT